MAKPCPKRVAIFVRVYRDALDHMEHFRVLVCPREYRLGLEQPGVEFGIQNSHSYETRVFFPRDQGSGCGVQVGPREHRLCLERPVRIHL